MADGISNTETISSVLLSPSFFHQSFSSDSNLICATLFPGDGIGPEIAGSVKQVVRGVVESLKIITSHAKLRVAEYAFSLFQEPWKECGREVAEKYPDIAYEAVVIENWCMMLVKNPASYDVLVIPNLFGAIISDLCAGLVRGLGLTPTCNIGEGGIALAEAVHGSAPDISGKDAVLKTIAGGKYRTGVLGGKSTTADFATDIRDHL